MADDSPQRLDQGLDLGAGAYPPGEENEGGGLGVSVHLSFRSRLTLRPIAAAILPRGRILAAIETASPRDGQEFIAGRDATDARSAFGMIDCVILSVDPAMIPGEERIPGEALPVRATLQTAEGELGLLVGHLPATRT